MPNFCVRSERWLDFGSRRKVCVLFLCRGKKTLIQGAVQFKESRFVDEKFDMPNFSQCRHRVLERRIRFVESVYLASSLFGLLSNFMAISKSSACRTFWAEGSKFWFVFCPWSCSFFLPLYGVWFAVNLLEWILFRTLPMSKNSTCWFFRKA